MTARDWTLIGAAIVLIVGVRELFPKRERVQIEIPVPTIVAVHDTVHDTLEIKQPAVVTTDTLQLLVQQTVYDTVIILSMVTDSVWPILSAQFGQNRGDTSKVVTFNLLTGQPALSRIWTPGPVRSIWASSNGYPRIDFYEPPVIPAGSSFWRDVKIFGGGFASCTITDWALNKLRGR